MKVWLDDIRKPPDDSWHWAKNVDDVWAVIDDLTEISFDHDLGEGNTYTDSRHVAKYFELMAYKGNKPPKWHIHSQNPVGAEWLTTTMANAERLYLRAKVGK